MSSRCGMQDYAAEFMYLQVGQRCEAVLKFFTKTNNKTKKNKKKMLFLPAMMADGSQGLREKNTLFGEQRRKGRFFPKQPEGLDLDGLGNQG